MRILCRLLLLMAVFASGSVMWVLLLPDQHSLGSQPLPGTAVARLPADDSAQTVQRKVRVVYADASTPPRVLVSPKIDTRIDPVDTATTTPRAGATGTLSTDAHRDVHAARLEPDVQPTDQRTPLADEPVSPVNLNTATVKDLNNIPGGGSIGRTIIAHRPYKSVDDLLNKRVVLKIVFDKIRQQVAAE